MTRGAPSWRAAALVLLGALLASCTGDPQGPCFDCAPAPDPPAIEAAAVTPGPHNVLSAVVTARLQHADSAAVRFGPPGGALDSVTPAHAPDGDSVSIPVLGLRAGTTYELRVVAFGGTDSTLGSGLTLTTGPLPADLPAYSAGGSSPSPGLVVFSSGSYGVVIDNTGTVVWYRRLEDGPTLNFEAQPTGTYATSPTANPSGTPVPWVEFDPLGNELRRMGCARGLMARFHELIAQPDGSYWLMCDEMRILDLTTIGGRPDAAVTGTVIQHVGLDGSLLFEWSVWDHFALTDLEPDRRTGATVNWTHGNALEFDTDGNLLVSFRSLNEITKIDLATGMVRWRMGGIANQFTFSTAGPPFVGQHGLRVVGPGLLQLLDNLGEPTGSRAERYQFDETTRTASLVGGYSSSPSVTAMLGGSSQVLPGGHLLVAYGNGYRVQEYDGTGAVVWEVHGDPGYIFRAQRIQSLYRPGVGVAR